MIKLYHERLAVITERLRWKLGLACCWPLDLMSHVLIERSRSLIRRSKVHRQSRIRPQLDKGDLYERIVPLVVVLGHLPVYVFFYPRANAPRFNEGHFSAR